MVFGGDARFGGYFLLPSSNKPRWVVADVGEAIGFL